MNDTLTLSLDLGKWSTVGMTQSTKYYCRTKVDKTEDGILGTSTKTHFVKLEGESYIVGEEAAQADYDTSKASFNHRLAMYTAIATIIGDRYKNLQLVVGCPAAIYKKADLRNDYRNYLLEKRAISINVDGVQSQFFIKDLILAPETLGYPYQNLEKAKTELVAVIDIGGLNTNGCIYNGLTPIKDSMFTVNLGSYILFTRIKNELSIALNQNIQDYEIPSLIEKAPTLEAQKIIDNILSSHTRLIQDEMKKNNWNVKGLKLRFIGGGSLDLKAQINKEFPTAIISQSAIYDNAKAFLKVGEIYYAKA